MAINTPCSSLVLTGKYADRLAMCSIVGYASEVKALRAAMAKNDTFRCSVEDGAIVKGPGNTSKSGCDFGPIQGFGYQVLSHRLGFNCYHAIFVSRTTGLILGDSDDALWRELRHERFSTPLLRGWVPYLRQVLVEKDLLTECFTFNSTALWLAAINVQLDNIVEAGLQGGHISIRKECA